MSDITRAEFIRLISKSEYGDDSLSDEAKYYVNLFDNYGFEKWPIKWNWCSALFTSTWAAYRRMHFSAYVYPHLYFFILWIYLKLHLSWFDSSYYSEVPENPFLTLWPWGLLMLSYILIWGFFGNIFYLRTLKKRLQEGHQTFTPRFWWILPYILYSGGVAGGWNAVYGLALSSYL